MRGLKRAREKTGEGNGERTKRERARREASVKEKGKKRGKKGRRASRASCHLRRTDGSLAYYAIESLSSLPFSLPLLLSVPSRPPTAKVSSPMRTLYAEFTRGVSRIRLASAAEKVQRRFERKDERKRG